MTATLDSHLIKALIDIAIFLEFTDDVLLNEDLSVQIMENLAAELQLINKNLIPDLIKSIRSIAHEYKDPEQALFVQQLPETFGIA